MANDPLTNQPLPPRKKHSSRYSRAAYHNLRMKAGLRIIDAALRWRAKYGKSPDLFSDLTAAIDDVLREWREAGIPIPEKTSIPWQIPLTVNINNVRSEMNRIPGKVAP